MAFRNQLTMCRLCLCENECFINIFERNDWQGYVAAEVISDLFQFKVSEADAYPHVVCLACLTKLTDFKAFKECCQKSLVKYDDMFVSRDRLEEHTPGTVELVTVKTEPANYSDGEGDVSKASIGINVVEFKEEPTEVQLAFVETVKDPQHLQPLKDKRPHCMSKKKTDANSSFGNISADGESTFEKSKIISSSGDIEASFSGRVKGEWITPEETVCVTPFVRGDVGIRTEREKEKTGGEEDEGVTGTAWEKGAEGEELECAHCGDVFTTKERLVQHVTLHVFGHSYDCHVCGKVFQRSHDRNRHLLIHAGSKQYKCEKCSKCFTQKGALKGHMNIHAAIKPYKCTECGKCFHKTEYLKMHVRTHTGYKPFKCTECSKAYTANQYLKRHMISHGSSKLHVCVECSKSFRHKSSLNRHMRSHTKPF